MSYQVLARKYRPQTFEDVVAQEHVTRTLRHALKRNRIGSGYLFTGPRGTGKTTVARILAKAINCVNGPTEHPCGECAPCREIASGSSLDVLEIDAASNTGVDDIRTLRENVRYLPTSGRRRVYIIDEVHRLSASAFDALLKTLEEPPEHVTFMFATTEPLKVPETILSRTQRFDFRRVSIDDLSAHLKRITEREKVSVDDTALRLLARKADGSVRDSLSLLDQIIAYAGEHIGEADVVNALGLVDRQLLFDFIDAVAARKTREALLLIRQVMDAGVDVADFLAELMEHLRVLMLLLNTDAAQDFLGLSSSELSQYKAQQEHFTTGDILRLLKTAGDITADLKAGIDERLLIELVAVKMSQLESTVSIEELLAILPAETSSGGSDLFNGKAKKKSDAQAKRSLTVTRPPGFEKAVRTSALNLPQVQAGWEDFLGVLRRRSPMLASQLGMATVREVKENTIELGFYASGATSLQVVQKADNLKVILDELHSHFGPNVRLHFFIDRNTAPPPETPENRMTRVDPKELLANSPRLRRLVEKVNGEIIGIRNMTEKEQSRKGR